MAAQKATEKATENATEPQEEEFDMSSMRFPGRKARRRDRGDAFLPDPAGGTFIALPDAESAAEEFITAVTSADFVLEEARNELSVDEVGGPFIHDDDDEIERYD
jgi:hypothetical protein